MAVILICFCSLLWGKPDLKLQEPRMESVFLWETPTHKLPEVQLVFIFQFCIFLYCISTIIWGESLSKSYFKVQCILHFCIVVVQFNMQPVSELPEIKLLFKCMYCIFMCRAIMSGKKLTHTFLNV